MNFREIEPRDALSLIELRARTRENAIPVDVLASMGITPESVALQLQSSHRGWLCEVDGLPVGFAIGDRTSGELWVIAVAPEYEGRGIGSRLLESVEKWLWDCGWNAIWLWTDADERRRAFTFYIKHGWQKTELKDGALYMQKRRAL